MSCGCVRALVSVFVVERRRKGNSVKVRLLVWGDVCLPPLHLSALFLRCVGLQLPFDFLVLGSDATDSFGKAHAWGGRSYRCADANILVIAFSVSHAGTLVCVLALPPRPRLPLGGWVFAPLWAFVRRV